MARRLFDSGDAEVTDSAPLPVVASASFPVSFSRAAPEESLTRLGGSSGQSEPLRATGVPRGESFCGDKDRARSRYKHTSATHAPR